jgi:hypothetical protein
MSDSSCSGNLIRRRRWKTAARALAFLLILPIVSAAPLQSEPGPSLRFEITITPGLLDAPVDGRLLVVLSSNPGVEPRKSLGETGLDAAPVLAGDVSRFAAGKVGILDGKAAAFPIADLAHLPPGDYSIQAVLDWNQDLRLPPNFRLGWPPGTLYSKVQRVHLDPAAGNAIKIELTEKAPAEALPAETERIKYVKFPSPLLSAFHKRPMFLRAGVRLPRDFAGEPTRRYPLRVHIGGYGSRYFVFPQDAAAGDGMVHLVLDGAGPLGDPYQVNSANNGPYGDALTRELIPYIEQRFRCIGQPYARVLDGKSTGGWVSLALQVFYPDYFNGCWSSCPDPVDFRCFQLIDIYQDTNAYVNRYGFERPGMRTTEGEVRETMRHQCQLENVLGRGSSWTTSGQQWGAWNAVFGPRGADGLPVPLWDPRTGMLNRQAAEHWKGYDLRLILQQNWRTLAPKLQGKIHVWVGEADDYFLNNAVHKLDAFLSQAQPPYGGVIVYSPGQGHCWSGLTEGLMIEQMLESVRKGPRINATGDSRR